MRTSKLSTLAVVAAAADALAAAAAGLRHSEYDLGDLDRNQTGHTHVAQAEGKSDKALKTQAGARAAARGRSTRSS